VLRPLLGLPAGPEMACRVWFKGAVTGLQLALASRLVRVRGGIQTTG
jgi:hypothetical protein